jgi:hypothetical protein
MNNIKIYIWNEKEKKKIENWKSKIKKKLRKEFRLPQEPNSMKLGHGQGSIEIRPP